MQAMQQHPEGGSAPVQVEQVLGTMRAAMSHSKADREPAEALLRSWEADAAPGFLHSLMLIVKEQQAVDEPMRLLAVVIAKNAVGSSWRKTLGTREWSRVPDEEKSSVRMAVLQLMLSDNSDRVALQLGLLATNICAFDFPSRWPDVLQNLLQAADWSSPFAPQFKLRALRALKHIFRGLTTKRFVAEPMNLQQPGGGIMGMATITERLNAERQLYKQQLKACAQPLQQLVVAHLPVFLNPATAATAAGGSSNGSSTWQVHGLFAKAAVNGLTELLPLIADQSGLPEGTRQLLELLHQAATQLMAGQPTGPPLPPMELAAWQDLGGRIHERICKCIIAHLDSHPLPFAEYVPYFLKLFVNAALLQLDAATLRAMRPKRRVLLVRFLAKALLCPYYRPEYVEAQAVPGLGMLPPGSAGHAIMARLQAARDAAAAASDENNRARGKHAAKALQELLSAPQVGQVVEALVLKYVALTHDELEEWRDDPEGYIRSIEVESGPDADTPRPVGVGLLLCMLERGGDQVAQALLELTGQLQRAGESNSEVVLMREACYRCIGEGYSHVSSIITFSQWYQDELSKLLRERLPLFLPPSAGGSAAGGGGDIIAAVLQARALWLVGACGQELQDALWVDAWGLAVAHMGAVDLVVALQAVQAVLLLAIQILDDQAILDQAAAAKLAESKRAGGSGNSQLPGLSVGNAAAVDAALTAAEAAQDDEVVLAAKARLEMRLGVLTGSLEQLLQHVFGLLGRLTEVESSVRLLQLVSVVAEAAGERLQPHLGALAAALPQVWEASTKHASGGNADTGALARLHSALMAVITHLIGRLRHAAMANEQLQGVMYPLLQYATNLSNPEAEVLVEEALKCWGVALAVEPSVAPQLVSLLPNMARLLQRGRDNTAAFQILEAYLLLQAGSALQPYGEVISKVLTRAITNVADAVLKSCGTHTGSNTAAAAAAGGGGGGGPQQQQQQQQQQMGQLQQQQQQQQQRHPQQLASEVTQEGLAAAALVDVMLQLYPADVPTLLLPCFMAMAQLVGNEALPLPRQGLPVKVVNVLEGFLEVLARLFLGTPQALQAVLPAGSVPTAAAAQAGDDGSSSSSGVASLQRFIDCWLLVASATFLEELLGVGHMAMLGRFRRRIATAAISRLIIDKQLPVSVLLERPERLARLAGVMVKVCGEVDRFSSDLQHLDGLDFEREMNCDFVLAARLQLSKGDAVRHLDVFQTYAAALNMLAASAGGEAGLMQLLAAGGSGSLTAGALANNTAIQDLQSKVSALMHGQLAAHLEAERAAQQQQEQRLQAQLAAGDTDWGSGGEETMM